MLKTPTTPAAPPPAAAATAPAPSSSSTDPAVLATPSPAGAALPAPAASATASTASTAAAAADARASFGDPSALALGPALQSAIKSMEEMGYDRAEIDQAMRAAFNNPDRAVEYLLTVRFLPIPPTFFFFFLSFFLPPFSFPSLFLFFRI